MSEFSSKDQPNFSNGHYSNGAPEPADKVILKLPGIPAPNNILELGQNVQPGQSADASPNQENVMEYELFVERGGSWMKFTANSPTPIESSTVEDNGTEASISINGQPAQMSPGEPAQHPTP